LLSNAATARSRRQPANRPFSALSPPARFLRRLFPLVLAIAVLAVWSGGLEGPFVFDDHGSIVNNPTLRDLRDLCAVLRPPTSVGETVGGRPLLNFSFALNHAIGGLDPRGYRAVNLLIHLAAALVLFAVLRRVLARVPAVASAGSPLAFAATLLWAVHPLQTAAVTYIVQRAESLAALCTLLVLLAFLGGLDSRRPARWHFAAVLAAAAGVATKETGAIAPLLVLLLDRAFGAGTFTAALKSRPWLYIGFGSTWLLLIALVLSTGNRGGSAGLGSTLAPLDYFWTQCGALVHYLRLVLWPRPLIFDHGTPLVGGPGAVWPQLLLLIALGTAVAWGLWRRRSLALAGATFFLLLAPTSSFVPVATQTLAEHRMYLPLAAATLLCALAVHRCAGPRVLLFATAFTAVPLALLTAERHRDYRDELQLWTHTATHRPDNPRAHNNLGALHLRAGRLADAVRHFETALHLQPNHASAHYNLAHAHLAAHRPADAARHFEAAAHIEQNFAAAHAGHGRALLALGQRSESKRALRHALALDERLADAWFDLGRLHAAAGDFAAAAAAWQRTTALEPDRPAAHANLGNALLLLDRPAEAIAAYCAALRLDPGNEAVAANLALAHELAASPHR
jgi:tetratricopeptide (TPR) repeat protein